jgi:hypothetical protein
MRGLLTEKNIVIVLFVMVFVVFSLAEKETKKIEQLYNGGRTSIKNFPLVIPEAKAKTPTVLKSSDIVK